MLRVPRIKKYNTQESNSRKNTGLESGCNAAHTGKNYSDNYNIVKRKTICDFKDQPNKE